MKIDVILDAGLPAEQVDELGQLADRYGIHTLWGSCFASRRDPLLTMAGLARTTTRVRLGTLPVSPYEVHPLRIADSLLTFNEFSKGRGAILIGGLGHSTMRVTGLCPVRRLDSVRDCVSILKGISPDTPLNYIGEQYQLTDYCPEWATATPPLIYVGATGPNMLRMSAALADGVMMSDVPLTRMKEVTGNIDQGLQDAGHNRQDFRINNFFAWHIKENREESMAEARQGLIWRGLLQEWHISTFLDEEECALVEANRPAFLNAFLQRSDRIEGVPESIVDRLVENLTFAGDTDTLDTVIKHLQDFAAAGLDEVALKVHENPAEAIRMIGERLVPALS
jgi:alkanesulfonate monooxygenase SsuD/methylene tetrahydromethanopterin reductase-like flavin-dependent oxidoreductase (luciferase family)